MFSNERRCHYFAIRSWVTDRHVPVHPDADLEEVVERDGNEDDALLAMYFY